MGLHTYKIDIFILTPKKIMNHLAFELYPTLVGRSLTVRERANHAFPRTRPASEQLRGTSLVTH